MCLEEENQHLCKEYEESATHSAKVQALQTDLKHLRSNIEWTKKELGKVKSWNNTLEGKILREKDECDALKSALQENDEKIKQLQIHNSNLLDEIIEVKSTISSLESNNGPFTSQKPSYPRVVKFKGKDSPLSNLYRCKLSLYDQEFHSSEQCYQWRKAIFLGEFVKANLILNSRNSEEAMKIGRNIQSAEWDKVKESYMEEILARKMEQVQEFKAALLETGEATLEENTAHEFGANGHYAVKGKKKMGEILTRLRACPNGKQSEKNQVGIQMNSTNQAKKSSDIIVIGNSHTTNLKLIGLRNKTMEIHEAYTVKEARVKKEQVDVKENQTVLYQLITNDVGQSEVSALKCASDIVSLARETKRKAKNVIISYSPPCGDKNLNELVYMANCRIEQLVRNEEHIEVCRHDNLGYSGYPKYNFLANDQKHLNTQGRYIYSRNLVNCIHRLCQDK